MTICVYCAGMAARSQRQLDIRRRNMAQAPDVMPWACDHCGGVDWASTPDFIDETGEANHRLGRRVAIAAVVISVIAISLSLMVMARGLL